MNDIENKILHVMPNDIIPNVVYLTDDKQFIAKRSQEIFDMLVKGYADKGGLTLLKTPSQLVSDVDLMKIVFSENGKVLACITYKYWAGGNKMFLGAAIRNDAGKNAIQEVCVDNLKSIKISIRYQSRSVKICNNHITNKTDKFACNCD